MKKRPLRATALLILLLVSSASTVRAQVPVAPAAEPAPTSPAQSAWERYRAALADQHTRLLAHPFARDPQVRAQGLYFLQSLEAVAFNLYVAPRAHYPALYTQSLFMPVELSWGMPNPDFLNHNGFVDGARTYRIWGNRRGNRWTTLQVLRGFWGDEAQGTLANLDFDELPVVSDGSFEIMLGPNPPIKPDGKTWIKLDPDLHNSMIALRETFYDWAREGPMELHVEMLDRAVPDPLTFGEAELATRIDRATKWSVTSFAYALAGLAPFTGGSGQRATRDSNRFYVNSAGRSQGGNPLGFWTTMLYDLAPDEALIIQVPPISARYWGFQLGSVWGQTTDYSYHQSSLNKQQIRPDRDGRYRAVLALSDPGVPNWLDSAGVPQGLALLRIYKGGEEVEPKVLRVKLTELRRHLPADTPQVTPAQRRIALDARRMASLRRYGQ